MFIQKKVFNEEAWVSAKHDSGLLILPADMFLIFFLIQVREHKHEKNVVCTLPLVLVKMKYIPSPATQSPTALQEACSPYESCTSILDAKLCVCLNGVRLSMHSAANLRCPPVQVLKPINAHILRQTNAHPQTHPGALFNGLKHWGWHSKTLHEHPSNISHWPASKNG